MKLNIEISQAELEIILQNPLTQGYLAREEARVAFEDSRAKALHSLVQMIPQVLAGVYGSRGYAASDLGFGSDFEEEEKAEDVIPWQQISDFLYSIWIAVREEAEPVGAIDEALEKLEKDYPRLIESLEGFQFEISLEEALSDRWEPEALQDFLRFFRLTDFWQKLPEALRG